MRPACLLIMVLAALLAAGCARRSPPMAAAVQPVSELDALAYGGARRSSAAAVRAIPPAARAAAGSADGPYALDSGDKLRVVVFGQDGLTNSYGVDAGGNITMPLIGSVAARGQTPSALSGAIGARLRQGFIREPHVAVEVEAYRPFFILGEVAFPGQYPYVPNMSVETAVAIAGGFSPRAQRSQVEISRPAGGQAVRRSAPLGTQVRPGDTIIVAERWF
jgi:polysaccharide export outer membrane protein